MHHQPISLSILSVLLTLAVSIPLPAHCENSSIQDQSASITNSISKSVYSGYDPKATTATDKNWLELATEGNELYKQGQGQAAARKYIQAYDVLKITEPKNYTARLKLMNNLASILVSMRQFDIAEECLRYVVIGNALLFGFKSQEAQAAVDKYGTFCHQSGFSHDPSVGKVIEVQANTASVIEKNGKLYIVSNLRKSTKQDEIKIDQDDDASNNKPTSISSSSSAEDVAKEYYRQKSISDNEKEYSRQASQFHSDNNALPSRWNKFGR